MSGSKIEELQREVQMLLAQISALSGWNPAGTDVFEKENERIEKYLSEFTQRQGVLLTVAGLLSIFSILDTQNMLQHFLLWVIPFLLLAIATYILSSKRIHIVSTSVDALASQPPDSREVNKLLRQHFYSVLKFHKLTDAMLVIFFTAFIFSYYTFVFVGPPELWTSILVAVIALLLGVLRYFYDGKIGNDSLPSYAAVGAPGPENPIPGHEIMFGGIPPEQRRGPTPEK